MNHCFATHSTEFPQATQHPTPDHEGGHCPYDIVDFLIDNTRCPKCGYTPPDRYKSKSTEVGRHMLTQHCLNVEQRKLNCRYCERSSSALSNINYHESRHFGDKPHVCGAQVKVMSDPPEVIVCNMGFNQTNDLARHKLAHEKNGFVVASAPSDRKRTQKIQQLNPEDRLPELTEDDRPKVCPKFNIDDKHLKKPLPPCFLLSTSGPQADASTSTSEAGPSHVQAQHTTTQTPVQHRPISSNSYNHAPPPAPFAFVPTSNNSIPGISPDHRPSSPSFASVHSTMDAYPYNFITPPPAPADCDASTSTTEAGPSRHVRRRAQGKKATTSFRPRPRSLKHHRPPSPSIPLAYTSTNFNGVPNAFSDLDRPDVVVDIPSTVTVSTSSHAFTTIHPLSPDCRPTFTDPSFPIQQPAPECVPPIAHEETVLNQSSWNDHFFNTTSTFNQKETEPHSYNLNLNAATPSGSSHTTTSVGPENGTLPSSDFPCFIPIAMNAQSCEEVATLPLPSPHLSSAASDFMSASTSEETAYNAPSLMDAQSHDLNVPGSLLGHDVGLTLPTFYPSLEPPPSRFIAAPTPEENIVDASLLNLQYLATTLTYPINISNLNSDIIRRITQLLVDHPFPHHRSWYENMTVLEFLEEVALHIMQLSQQRNTQYSQQYEQQYVQQYEQPEYYY
ncbi:hypothetical protein NLI96_g2130 [Meripilus lineatus]|uniref:C2H2-type domain-containing protein n=1 Tax=Meripilus lineatus TaxID=2056292 RepID=A0AAD5V948_9APHY|nr:hypothetical protein NLI96_g2130 [Physisporinus lineatus]